MHSSARHFVEFYKSSERLAPEIAGFTSVGLAAGEAVIIVACARHRELIVKSLAGFGVDSAWYGSMGQLKLRNAEETLAAIMSGGEPDLMRFRAAFCGMIDEAKAAGYEHIRIYGEMAPMLWRGGNFAAAVQLEEYAHELGNIHNVPIFCAYMLDGFSEESYVGPLEEIGRTHSDVVPTAEDERLREAIEAATRELFGAPVSKLLRSSEGAAGERRLPSGQRAILWLKRIMPQEVAGVLQRARRLEV